MSYVLRAMYQVEAVVDELPLDLESTLTAMLEDGSADLVVGGDVIAECLCCNLDPIVCSCVSDDEDASLLDQASRYRDSQAVTVT